MFQNPAQCGLHGVGIRQLGRRLPGAVAAVDRLVLGQNPQELQAVLFNLLANAVIQLAHRGPIDDEAQFTGLQLQLADHLRDPGHGLDAPAGAVGDEKHSVHMG